MTELMTEEYNTLRLQCLPSTIWTTQVKPISAIFEKTAEVKEALQSLSTNQLISRDTKARIQRLLKHQMSSLDSLFGLNATRKLPTFYEVFKRASVS